MGTHCWNVCTNSTMKGAAKSQISGWLVMFIIGVWVLKVQPTMASCFVFFKLNNSLVSRFHAIPKVFRFFLHHSDLSLFFLLLSSEFYFFHHLWWHVVCYKKKKFIWNESTREGTKGTTQQKSTFHIILWAVRKYKWSSDYVGV